MEILRSNVMNSIENVEDKPALGGLFGSEGFFFQQRRGHLDLRSIAAINLEKLVREVDVDVLQIHIENITFCNLREEDLRYLTDPQIVKLFRISQLMLEYLLYSQDKLVDNLNHLSHKYSEKKRGLSKKRRELVELEESTKLLRNQVKAKKQNIATLEDLLKEANRTREKELRKLRMQKGAEIPDEKHSVVKFFIAGPEGLCVEFVEKAETEISQLLREARKAFISVRDHDYAFDPNLVELRLVFKGRLLLPEQTIEECGIKPGDTLMALLLEPKKEEKVSAAPPAAFAPATAPTMDPEHFTRQMFEIMSKQNQEQMREIVQDINSGWKTALETISANNKPVIIEREKEPASHLDNQALADMQGRWSRSELALQLKLEEVQHKQALSDQELSALQILAMRRRMKLGDLESDDEPPVRREPPAAAPAPGLDTGLFMGRIERVEHQTTYTSIDVERMRAELDELKRLMALRPEPTTIFVTTPAPAPEPVKPKEFRVVTSEPELIKTRSNKWDALQNMKSSAPVPVPVPVPIVAPKEVVFEMEPAPKPVEVKVPIQEPPAKPPVKAAKPVPKPEPIVEVVPVPLGDVDVGFPAQFNPELAVLLGTKEPFYVTVPADIPVDDLLFELRKAASTKTRTKFAKVALEYKGQRALLGIDLGDDGADMTAETARTAAAAGDLRLIMMPGHPLTNAQIDMLVPSWEKNKVFTAGGVSASEDESRGKSAAGNKARLKKKREWDEGDSPIDSPMRQSGASVQSLAEEDDRMDPATLERGVYRQMRTSLDEALSEISEKEGLTDDELQRRIAKIKDSSDTLPKEVSEHLRNYKGSMVGALAAAAADSGSDTAGATLAGTDEMLRTSTGGILSARDGMMSRSVSMSLSLPRREGSFGSTGNLLRMSGASARSSPSPGPGDPLNMSMSSMGSKARRSLEQFDDEDGMNSDNLLEDTPMLASLTSSSDFRRQTAAPMRTTPSADKPPTRVTSGVGIAQPSTGHATDLEASRTGASLSSTLNVDSDSLMYSPAVSVSKSVRSNTARSRYSTEENDTEEEELVHHLDDATRQPPPKAARPERQEDFRGRWAKHDVDASAEEEEEGASWAAAARPVDISAQSFGDEPEYRADAKNADRRDGDGKLVDSVDSFKREFRAGKNAREEGGFKGEMSVTESDDRFRNTGDYTAMSSIPTLNETVTTFGDQDASYFRDHEGTGTNTRSSLGNTGHSDLTSTGESDGDVLHPRGGSSHGGAGGARGRSNSRSNNVQSFNDDEGSINSLALSDSNNLDD